MTDTNLTIYDRELLKAKANARSFPGLKPPNSAWYIGSIKNDDDTTNYYKDDEGNYYFDTEKGRAFEKEMQEAQKRNRWSA